MHLIVYWADSWTANNYVRNSGFSKNDRCLLFQEQGMFWAFPLKYARDIVYCIKIKNLCTILWYYQLWGLGISNESHKFDFDQCCYKSQPYMASYRHVFELISYLLYVLIYWHGGEISEWNADLFIISKAVRFIWWVYIQARAFLSFNHPLYLLICPNDYFVYWYVSNGFFKSSLTAMMNH